MSALPSRCSCCWPRGRLYGAAGLQSLEQQIWRWPRTRSDVTRGGMVGIAQERQAPRGKGKRYLWVQAPAFVRGLKARRSSSSRCAQRPGSAAGTGSVPGSYRAPGARGSLALWCRCCPAGSAAPGAAPIGRRGVSRRGCALRTAVKQHRASRCAGEGAAAVAGAAQQQNAARRAACQRARLLRTGRAELVA